MDKSQHEKQESALGAGVRRERGDFILKDIRNWDDAYSVIESCMKKADQIVIAALAPQLEKQSQQKHRK